MNDNDAHAQADNEQRASLRLKTLSSSRKQQVMPPNRCPPTIAAQNSAASGKASNSKSVNQLDTFVPLSVDVFAQQPLGDCSSERRKSVVTPRGVSTYSTKMSSSKKSVRNMVTAMGSIVRVLDGWYRGLSQKT